MYLAACSRRHTPSVDESWREDEKGREKEKRERERECGKKDPNERGPEENRGHEERRSAASATTKQGPGACSLGWVIRSAGETNGGGGGGINARTGPRTKPLTDRASQPTSLYDKYKRRAQRLLLIAWQKLRNPHFVPPPPPPPRTLSYRRSLESTSSLFLSPTSLPRLSLV